MNSEAIGVGVLGDASSELWAPDDYDLIVIIDGEWEYWNKE